ncbi:MAG TPA: hypothetical protein VM734_21200 [Kofleriaceae bacterium]|nr:hypothetical protein [Kofleriaceae bacterium]
MAVEGALERRVGAAAGDQLIMRAALDDLAAVEDDDLVRVADGRQAMPQLAKRAVNNASESLWVQWRWKVRSSVA